MTQLDEEFLILSKTTYHMMIECEHGTIIEIEHDEQRKQYMMFDSDNLDVPWLSVRINGELIRFDEMVNGACTTDHGIITVDGYEEFAMKMLANVKQKPASVKKIELGFIQEA